MSCEHDCTPAAGFPKPIDNRPALDTIDYRIGDYGSMRSHILAQIDAAPELALWTHRGPDDPGIALAESAAAVGDILSFYQHVYANEAYLRTAKWRESVSDLVRVLGYRLAPGLGGVARFAIAVKGAHSVPIPAGFAITAELPSSETPATFETTAELQAMPRLSRFHLYRPRTIPPITNGCSTFQLDPGNDIALGPGDRLLVGIVDSGQLLRTQILVVESVRESFGVREVRTRGNVTLLGGGQSPSRSQLRAYKILASARHFGHNAPATRVAIDSNGRASEEGVGFSRRLDASQAGAANPPIAPDQLPLEGGAADFEAGIRLLVEARFSTAGSGPGVIAQLVTERTITRVLRRTCAWGASSGECALLQVDSNLAVSFDGRSMRYADIRTIAVHAVEGQGFRLRAASMASPAVEGNVLEYFGRQEDAAALDGRALLIALPSGIVSAKVQRVVAWSRSSDADAFFRLTLDRRFDYSGFGHDAAKKIDVYGNLVEATEGKTEAEAAIGDGDARVEFQTFALPKAPLTYLLDAAAASPRLPQLEIWVDRTKWRRVDSLFGAGPHESVYIVREGDDGRSFVQFGDGRTGARLPSGRGNVVARYRTGSGAHGLPAPDKVPSAKRKVPGFEELWMLEPATLGCVPETAAGAQAAAPMTMQSLGRVVSLADFESEALAMPGVLKARAAWSAVEGLSEISVTVLTASGSVADAAAIDLALRRALAARGPSRCPMRVRIGTRRPVRVALLVAYDESRRTEDIARAIAAALGVEDDDPADEVDPGRRGLLHWRMRTFGEALHGSQVLAAVQNVPGVAWVTLRELRHATSRLVELLPGLRQVRVPLTRLHRSGSFERITLRVPPHEMLSLPHGQLILEFAAVAQPGASR